MKTTITFSIDTDALPNYTDEHVAQLWHIAQANPVPISDAGAGELAENIGREIIRRWLKRTGAALWNHQGRHAYHCALMDLGATWNGERWVLAEPASQAQEGGAA